MAHTHPRAKTTYMTNPKCLNVIHQNTSLYILFMLFYHIWTLPILTNIYVAKTKQRMADTHLSIETTCIAYPICYMMLPNMPFRKAGAHPLRLNTRCKDLTLVPSRVSLQRWQKRCQMQFASPKKAFRVVSGVNIYLRIWLLICSKCI